MLFLLFMAVSCLQLCSLLSLSLSYLLLSFHSRPFIFSSHSNTAHFSSSVVSQEAFLVALEQESLSGPNASALTPLFAAIIKLAFDEEMLSEQVLKNLLLLIIRSTSLGSLKHKKRSQFCYGFNLLQLFANETCRFSHA